MITSAFDRRLGDDQPRPVAFAGARPGGLIFAGASGWRRVAKPPAQMPAQMPWNRPR